MKTTFNNSELCHVWASQSQETGKGSNLNFVGKKLFSYGWYCIGMFINSDTILIRKSTYSNSTAKHINYMHRAIGSHIKTIIVEYLPDERYSSFNMQIEHEKNINSFVKEINSFLPTFEKARTNKQYLYSEYLRNIESLQSYCMLFDIPMSILPVIDIEYIERELNKVETKRKEKEEKDQAFYNFLKENSAIALQELKQNWIEGKTNKTSLVHSSKKGNIYFPIEETLLRLNDNVIQTSKGASVPLREAKILYDMIQAGKDIKGFRIGNYTVIGINGVLTIGCHKIERNEIERFAKLMNW